MTETTYAKAGGPPDDWPLLRVIDAAGEEIPGVVEVNTEECWLIAFALDERGRVSRDGAASRSLSGGRAASGSSARDDD